MFVFLGRYNAVLAYPRIIASYTVSVRQYRTLQSGFLHCCRCRQPACHLLMFRVVTPAHKGLSPFGKKNKLTLLVARLINICIFEIFIELSAGYAQLMQGTHKQ